MRLFQCFTSTNAVPIARLAQGASTVSCMTPTNTSLTITRITCSTYTCPGSRKSYAQDKPQCRACSNREMDSSRSITNSNHDMIWLPALCTPWRRLCTRCFGSSTSPCLFDLKKYEAEKRRRRELERAGIDPNDGDDATAWVAPEEQQRIDEEAEERQAEERERVKVFLAKRDAEDAQRRQKYREFRAQQIAMSKNRKEEIASVKQARRGAARRHLREDVDESDDEVVGEDASVDVTESAPSQGERSSVPASSTRDDGRGRQVS